MGNIKQVYRFRKFIRSILKFSNENHKECILLDKHIYYGEDLKDDNLISLIKIAKMISNNTLQINYEFVKELYTSYYPKEVKKALNNGEIEMVLNFIKNEDMFSLFKLIFKYNIFGTFNFYMCYCLYNKLYFLKHDDFIIINRNYHGYAIKLFKENKIDELNKFVKKHNEEISTPKVLPTIEDLRDKLKTIDKDLLEFVGVKKIYLFGSLANGNSSQYSDVDILILTDNKNSNDITNSKLLYMDLTSKLGYNINVVTHDLNRKADKFILANLLDAVLILDNGVI